MGEAILKRSQHMPNGVGVVAHVVEVVDLGHEEVLSEHASPCVITQQSAAAPRTPPVPLHEDELIFRVEVLGVKLESRGSGGRELGWLIDLSLLLSFDDQLILEDV